MSRATAALLGIALVAAVVTAGAAVAQESTGSGYQYQTLAAEGTAPSGDFAGSQAIRNIGDPTRGQAALRYQPASLFSDGYEPMERNTTVHRDRVQLLSTVFGSARGEYSAVVVYWDKEEVVGPNGTVQGYRAADQSVQRTTVSFGSGRDSSIIRLKSHYNEPKQVTVWLEKDGERVKGAQWRFRHETLASAESVAIATERDAWAYAGRVAFLPGLVGIILGGVLAKATLRETKTGMGLGLGAWALLGGVGGFVAVSALWFEITAVVARFDVLIGLSLGVVSYGVSLRMGHKTEKIRFVLKNLRDARAVRDAKREEMLDDREEVATDGGEVSNSQTSVDGNGPDSVEIPSDSYQDLLYESATTLETVKEGGKRYVVKKGIRPFLGRLFADPPTLSVSHLKTRTKVEGGKVVEKVFADPESDVPVDHSPATLRSRWPVWHRLDTERATAVEKVLFGAATVGALALPVIGWRLAESTANVALAGAVVGTVLLAIESFGADSGHVSYQDANRHFVSADASLTILQDEYKDGKTVEEMEQIAWQERARTAREARELAETRDRTVLAELNNSTVGVDTTVPTDATRMGGPGGETARADGSGPTPDTSTEVSNSATSEPTDDSEETEGSQ